MKKRRKTKREEIEKNLPNKVDLTCRSSLCLPLVLMAFILTVTVEKFASSPSHWKPARLLCTWVVVQTGKMAVASVGWSGRLWSFIQRPKDARDIGLSEVWNNVFAGRSRRLSLVLKYQDLCAKN